MTRTLLIDADLLAYRASAAHERRYDWSGTGQKSIAADEEAARQVAAETIESLTDTLRADAVLICLSDDFNSFRKDRIDPTYKALRNNVERPQHLYDLKEWLAQNYPYDRRRALEADDVMGIIATDPTRTDERIIVSEDKDMQTVPGLLYRRGKLQRISVKEADRFHLWQTLVGDVTDGYPGLPGVGPKHADPLTLGIGWEPYQHELRGGPRRGQVEIRWRNTAMSPWEAVVSAYVRAGLTEADALKQARLARILRYEDYDGHSPILWNPPAR